MASIFWLSLPSFTVVAGWPLWLWFRWAAPPRTAPVPSAAAAAPAARSARRSGDVWRSPRRRRRPYWRNRWSLGCWSLCLRCSRRDDIFFFNVVQQAWLCDLFLCLVFSNAAPGDGTARQRCAVLCRLRACPPWQMDARSQARLIPLLFTHYCKGPFRCPPIFCPTCCPLSYPSGPLLFFDAPRQAASPKTCLL